MSGGDAFQGDTLAVTDVPAERELAKRFVVRRTRDEQDAALLLDAIFGEVTPSPMPRGLRSAPPAEPKPREPHRPERAVCGSMKGYRIHQSRHEAICQPCKDAAAKQRAAERAAAKALLEEAAAAANKCGTLRGYRLHLEQRTVPCQACCDVNAATSRKYRPGPTKRRAADTRCGTDGGYQKHMRNRKEPCQPCKDAHAEVLREYRAKRKVAA